MSQKELSIIIPHYESVGLLEKLLFSIPNKNEIEVIVVDDNSLVQRKQFDVLKENSELKHVCFLRNSTNIQSAGTCRNIGLSQANGNWILFADSDDYFLEGFYEVVREYFNSDYDIVYFNTTSIYLDTQEVSNRHLKYKKLVEDFYGNANRENEIKLRYQYSTPWAKLINRDLIIENNISFDEVIAWNDMMFSTKVGYYANNIKADLRVIYCITRSRGSLTTLTSEDVIDSRIDVFIRYCSFIETHLNKHDQKNLNLFGIGKVLMVYKSNLGFKKVFEVIKRFRKNKIKFFNLKMFNPFFFYNKVKDYIDNHSKEKAYYSKTKNNKNG